VKPKALKATMNARIKNPFLPPVLIAALGLILAGPATAQIFNYQLIQ